MRRLMIPAALAFVPLAGGCAPTAAPADVAVVDAAVDVVCEGRRTDAGRVTCHREGIPPGSPFVCIQRSCEADDGGADLGDCCRLI